MQPNGGWGRGGAAPTRLLEGALKVCFLVWVLVAQVGFICWEDSPSQRSMRQDEQQAPACHLRLPPGDQQTIPGELCPHSRSTGGSRPSLPASLPTARRHGCVPRGRGPPGVGVGLEEPSSPRLAAVSFSWYPFITGRAPAWCQRLGKTHKAGPGPCAPGAHI